MCHIGNNVRAVVDAKKDATDGLKPEANDRDPER